MGSLEYANRTVEVGLASTNVPLAQTHHSFANMSNYASYSPLTKNNSVTTDLLDNDPTMAMVKAAVDRFISYAEPAVCILGIIGNVTSFIVFVSTSFRFQPCSQYLAALTFADTCFLVSQLLSSLMAFVPELATMPGYCSVMVYLSYVCGFLSPWLVVLMMAERYIVVRHPFRASTICSKRKSLVLISILVAVGLAIYSHSIFTPVASHRCRVDENFMAFVQIFTYVDTVLCFVVPFLAIFLLNVRIICIVRSFRLRYNLINRSVYRCPRYHSADKTLSIAQVRSTKMLVRVSTVFVVLYLPSYATRLYGLLLHQIMDGEVTPESMARFQVAQRICLFLYLVNFAIDFFVYALTSHNFRRNLCKCSRIHSCR